MTAVEFHKRYYMDNRIVLQTCYAAHGSMSWGRYFVFASPR
jgi:hypothetical protein